MSVRFGAGCGQFGSWVTQWGQFTFRSDCLCSKRSSLFLVLLVMGWAVADSLRREAHREAWRKRAGDGRPGQQRGLQERVRPSVSGASLLMPDNHRRACGGLQHWTRAGSDQLASRELPFPRAADGLSRFQHFPPWW